MKALKKMTKKQARERGYCVTSCGLWCNTANECNADLFKKIDENGYLVSDKSEFCRLTVKEIKARQREYSYNPITMHISKRK